MIETLVLLVVAGLAGGLPLLRGWSSHGLHVLASVSAGVLLGTVFLHLLPELARAEAAGHARLPWVVGLAGFLFLFFVEKVWLAPSRDDSHQLVWMASYVGLCVHAVVAGLALSTAVGDRAGVSLLVAIALHKIGESFSLATVMRLAHLPGVRILALLGLFALVTPIGVLVGRAWSTSGVATIAVEGFACGTFLYVAACDLLPEVFHGKDGRWMQGAAVVLGAAAVGAAEWV